MTINFFYVQDALFANLFVNIWQIHKYMTLCFCVLAHTRYMHMKNDGEIK